MTIAVDLGRKATKQTKSTPLGVYRIQRIKNPMMIIFILDFGKYSRKPAG